MDDDGADNFKQNSTLIKKQIMEMITPLRLVDMLYYTPTHQI